MSNQCIQPDTQGLPLSFHHRPDGETVAVLLSDLAYYTSIGWITVPKGFQSDGCSMPRMFWRVFGHPFSMWFLREAILHDWLYWEQPCDRKTADRVFKEKLKQSSRALNYWRIFCIHAGLRLFGWMAWNNNQRKKETNR